MAVSELDYRLGKRLRKSTAAITPCEPMPAPLKPVPNRKSLAMKEYWRKRKLREPEPANHQMAMSFEAPEEFERPVGFFRLRERHRVKAVSRKIVEQ